MSICAVCGSGSLLALTTATGLRHYCPACFHGQRAGQVDFPYASRAMGSTGVAPERLSEQGDFLAAALATGGATVLEVGCAAGTLAAALRRRFAIARYDAIELSPAGKTAEDVVDHLFDQPLTTLVEQNRISTLYDVIVCSHVLEHIRDLHAELAAMARVLAADGTLFLEVPNRSGHAGLPLDDNLSHLHFFSPTSLCRLLASHGFETVSAATGGRLDARYPDSLRVLARRFRLPQADHSLLGRQRRLIDGGPLVVWGAGAMATELLGNFLDPARIRCFVDRDPAKWGQTCLGRPIHAPEELRRHPGQMVLINSIEFADAIRADIQASFGTVVGPVLDMRELLDDLDQGGECPE
jgi:SAM-dependent methyltransferase